MYNATAFTGIEYFVTHGGPDAHRDEFVAISLALASAPDGGYLPVYRRDPLPEELASRAIAVIDVGGVYDDELMNFDHHQLSRDAAPTCSISMVLRKLGIYQEAREVLAWVEFSEVMDSKGPARAAALIGADPERFFMSVSPVENYMLRQFGGMNHVLPGTVMHDMMLGFGRHYIDLVERIMARLDVLAHESEVTYVGAHAVLLTHDVAATLDDPTLGTGLFCKRLSEGQMGADPCDKVDVAAVVSNDDRGPGLSLFRRNDARGVDFTRIADVPGVRYVHPSGFIAKTDERVSRSRLMELLHSAMGVGEV